MRARSSWSVSALVVALVVALGLLPFSHALAQESGGSFGGSAWDDEPSGSSGSSGSSDWGSSGGSDYDDHADEARRAADEAQREADHQRAEEEARRRAEGERQRAEEEARRRAEEEARIARERARRLALPPAQRVAELAWPATPPIPVLETPLDDATRAMGPPVPSISTWPGRRAPPDVAVTERVDGPISWSVAPCAGACSLLFLLPLALLIGGRRERWAEAGSAFAPAFASASASASASGSASASASASALAGERTAALARRVSIAFDWTARPALQGALAALAKRSDVKSRDGLHAAVREISALLATHAGAARYAIWEVSANQDARSWFQRRVLDLRARFKSELVRNAATIDAGERTARADEGEGLVVVTVLVATKVPLAGPPAIISPDALAFVLRTLVTPRPQDVQALEVVWSPAAENDRMSSFELEQFYPELQRMTEGVGRTQCAYCRAPFPAELGRCPACGAPV